MNILISMSNLYMGGAQTFVVNLSEALSKRHRVYIYCVLPDQVESSLKNRLPASVRLIFFPTWLDNLTANIDHFLVKKNIRLWINDLCKKIHYLFYLKLYNVRIINSHLFHSDKFITEKTGSRIPVIITDHGDYNYVIEQGFADITVVRKIFDVVNHVVYISENNKNRIKELTGRDDGKFTLINNGIPRRFISQTEKDKISSGLNIKPGDFIFGMVARGIPEKGWEIAISAFLNLNTKDITLHLILVGDSDYLKELHERYIDHKNIHFLGQVSDPLSIMSIIHVGLLPSYFQGESMPMAVIEFLSCDVPVIATDTGSLGSMLEINIKPAGQLLKPDDDNKPCVDTLSSLMNNYIMNQSLYTEHKNNCRFCFSRFDIDNVTKEYEKVFLKCLS